eukprot:sb/3465687/
MYKQPFNSLLEENAVTVLKDVEGDWPIQSLRLNKLSQASQLENETVKVKSGIPYTGGTVPRETDCEYRVTNLRDFCKIVLEETTPKQQFHYLAYQHMIHTTFLKEYLPNFSWAWAGLPARSLDATTLWIGTAGSFTPVHKDTYGCNLHYQVEGRKEWLLWPPEYNLSPTRFPYEESSVFSSTDIRGDPKIMGDALKIILEPGQAIFIPKHWWHLVTSLEGSVSVNTWVELPCDQWDQVSEAVVRFIVCGVMEGRDGWLNPGEEVGSQDENRELLRRAVGQVEVGVRRVKANTDHWSVIKRGGEVASHPLNYKESDSDRVNPLENSFIESLVKSFESGDSSMVDVVSSLQDQDTAIETTVDKIVCDKQTMERLINAVINK